ncbi:MAG: hypothetical protein CSB23_01175 [Deltaproteobacteria bacterium]|nr:MAG: hypothetical protein CSB23_01175 [Deltaproteobacteria bacterium]
MNKMNKKMQTVASKRHIPIRRCCSCGVRREKSELLRFVWSEGGVQRDYRQILPGRGVFCCDDLSCLRVFEGKKRKWKQLFHRKK